jgi:hypothetical protein
MSAIDMAGTMDALAAKVPTTAAYRVFAWPVEDVTPPCVVVGYPTSIDFDLTMDRGSDMAVFPVWYVVGKVAGKQARDALSAIITGAAGIKNALDGPLTVGSSTADVRVTDCTPETITVAAVPYLAARFDCEVIT